MQMYEWKMIRLTSAWMFTACLQWPKKTRFEHLKILKTNYTTMMNCYEFYHLKNNFHFILTDAIVFHDHTLLNAQMAARKSYHDLHSDWSLTISIALVMDRYSELKRCVAWSSLTGDAIVLLAPGIFWHTCAIFTKNPSNGTILCL